MRSTARVVLSTLVLALASCQIEKPAHVLVENPSALTQPADGTLFLSFRASGDEEPTADPESPFWKGIPGVVMDKSVLGGPMPGFRAEIRARWTEHYYYFLFAGHYQQLTINANPKLAEETPHLWEKDVFELYLGADSVHTNRYRELQLSPQGEWLDNDIDSTVRRPGFNGEEKWNSGMVVKARIWPEEKVWFGEMKIPFAAVDQRTPKEGSELRVNMYRQDGVGRDRDFLAWQPTGAWNPHHPEKFGILKLTGGR